MIETAVVWLGVPRLRRARPRPLLRGLLLLLLLLVPTVVQGEKAPDAAEILRRAEAIRNPELDYAVDFEIQISEPGAMVPERSSAYTLLAQGKDRSLVLTREPERLYGSTLIIDAGRYWLLLPRASRSLELSPRQRLGGSVANGDLARANLERDYTPSLVGKESLEGEPCWLLELTAAGEKAAYPKIRAWISRDDFRPVCLEYHGNTGQRLRRACFLDYRESALGRRAHRIEVEEEEGSEARTTIHFRALRPVDLGSVELGEELLVKARDQALALRRTGGAAASAEALARALRDGPGGS